jgi:hypothetical protein
MRPGLQDTTLPNSDCTWFVGGSSFMLNGKRLAGYVAVSVPEVIGSSSLLSKTLAQKVELTALT